MILRKSRFVHVLPLGNGRHLAIHALTHLRLAIDREVAWLIDWFETSRDLAQVAPALVERMGCDLRTLQGCVASLFERSILTDKTPDEELASTALSLGETHGRDPGELLDRHRREHGEGALPYWSVTAARGVADLDGKGRRLDILLLGDCELQMEADFLRREGAARGLDLKIAATFPEDVRLAGEHKHDAVIVGALKARREVALGSAADHGGEPFRPYLAEARRVIEGLRALTQAPILIDNLPEPTVQPLGLAERGRHGHRNRYRSANLALAELVEGFADAHVIDVAAALAGAGSETLLDDGLTSFTHFGSPGWMLQRPASERQAVHGIFPDTAPLAARLGGDPYRREAIVAKVHVDVLIGALGIGRKKCVIVDLDGTLWPGVLAETGAPFAWHPEISGLYSYVALYFGLHEALKALKQRGILLACVSKNDEATVRELWRYPEHYPHERLLTPDDFVTWRINWRDKPENIRAIAEELGFALDAFAFIDDHPVERERVRQMLPEIEVWGEDPFALRRILLADPRLQPPHITKESGARTGLVRAQLERSRLRADYADEREFIASLNIVCEIDKLSPGADVDRVRELFERTTQFNATARKFTAAELADLIGSPDAAVFTLKVKDRFGDQGLVGAAVLSGSEITGFVLSCRVIGLRVEHELLAVVLADAAPDGEPIIGRIVETKRNLPARNLYADHGFMPLSDGEWRYAPQPIPTDGLSPGRTTIGEAHA